MTHTKQATPDISIQVLPKANYLVVLRHFISCLSASMGFDETEVSQLEMCLDEACSNSFQAMKESGSNTDKHIVQIDIRVDCDSLHIVVHDSGKDFTHHLERATPMTDETDRTKKRGYGLKIIKTFMDEVNYIHLPEVGNQLRLTKYRSK